MQWKPLCKEQVLKTKQLSHKNIQNYSLRNLGGWMYSEGCDDMKYKNIFTT